MSEVPLNLFAGIASVVTQKVKRLNPYLRARPRFRSSDCLFSNISSRRWVEREPQEVVGNSNSR